ncbi:MAG: hypothetical protein V7L21_35960 [Nostoc sp.]
MSLSPQTSLQFLQIGKILSVSPMRSQFSCKFLSKCDIYAVCDRLV